MDIPNTLNVLGRKYKVIFRRRNRDDGVDRAGACNPWYQKIWVDEAQGEDSKVVTLLHEFIEIIKWECELDIKHQDISTLSNTLFQALNDNNLLKH